MMRKLNAALFDAIKENNTSAVLELLESGANPNAYEAVILRGYEKCRRSLLHVALRATDDRGFGVDVPENISMISALIDFGADVNAKDTNKFTPIRLAAWTGKLETGRLLLDRGADINATDHQGQTPLMLAACKIDGGLVLEELLQRGAKVNLQNSFGATALMYAVNHPVRSPERVRLLLRYGADVNLTDRQGRTVFSLLEYRSQIPEVAEVLEVLRNATL